MGVQLVIPTLAAVACLCLAASAPLAQAQEQASPFGVNVEDGGGDRIWYGSEPPEVTRLADVAERISQTSADNVLAVALTSDRQVVEVFVLDESADDVRQLRTAAAGDPRRLRIIVNEHSAAELDAAQQAVLGLDWKTWGIESVGADVIHDSLRVGVAATSTPRPSSDDVTRAVERALRNNGVLVPVEIRTEAVEGSAAGPVERSSTASWRHPGRHLRAPVVPPSPEE